MHFFRAAVPVHHRRFWGGLAVVGGLHGFERAGFECHEASEITLECPKMVLKLEDVYESVGLG